MNSMIKRLCENLVNEQVFKHYKTRTLKCFAQQWVQKQSKILR